MARACCIYKHVLQIQLEASLTAKPNKCLFRFRELDCLVYVLVNDEIHPIQEKIDAMNKIPAPQTKAQVRFVIEMIWFYRNVFLILQRGQHFLLTFSKQNLYQKVFVCLKVTNIISNPAKS